MFKIDRASRLTSCIETTDPKPLQTLLAAFFFLVACSSLALAQGTPPDTERAVEVFTDDMAIEAESREAETQRQEEAELGRTTPSGPSYRVTSFQLNYLEELEGFDAKSVQGIMRDNARELNTLRPA